MLALTLLGACRANHREERRQNGTVILNLGGDPKSLDPGRMVDVISARASMTFIRGLTILDAQAVPQAELAERWEVSPDGTVYDFYLRDTKWTNGEPVTSEDYVYAWVDRMLQRSFASEYAYMLFYIEGAQEFFESGGTDRSLVGVEAVAPLHLRVRLAAPAPFFPQLVAHHSYFPICKSADLENPNWALRAETYVGNGPFVMKTFSPGESLVGVKNPDYWNADEVQMNELAFRFIEEETTERLAFDAGEIDATYLAPRPDLEELAKGDALHIAPQIGTYYLNFNMPLEEFSDLRVRKALTLAIDRASIVKNVARAGETPAFALVPPEIYQGERKPYFEDAQYEEARRLLAEAGYPGGEGFPKITYLYNTLEIHRSIAQVLQETWKRELGIVLELENQEFRTVIENRNQGNFMMARNGWIADFADPINFLEIFLSYSGNNNSHWKDTAYDELLERARTEPDPDLRLAILAQAEDHLMAELPIIPIYYYAHPYLCTPELEGYDLTPMNSIDVAKLRWK